MENGEDEKVSKTQSPRRDDRTNFEMLGVGDGKAENGNISLSGQEYRTDGLKLSTAIVFIIGEVAGAGVLAEPRAVADLGWVGLPLIAIFCLVSAYTGSILGKCWILLRDIYPEYTEGPVRYPYPSIGFRAFSKPGRYLVSISINISLFGISVVFTLLVAESIQQLLQDVNVKISFCYWMVVIVIILTPFTWLGSPKDMWPVAVGAAMTIVVASILIIANILIVADKVESNAEENFNIESVLRAFGTLFFAFGNQLTFPTIQHDMKEPTKFHIVSYASFAIALCIYLPVACAGYFVFGGSVSDNILTSIYDAGSGPIRVVTQILMIVHFMFAVVIMINPFCQEIEEMLNIPHEFNVKRAICRTVVMGSVLFVAESIPKFGNILSLIGGSTTAILAYVLPVLFYNKLCDINKRPIPLHQRVFHYEIMVVAALIGAAATYAAIEGIVAPHAFALPCYINLR